MPSVDPKVVAAKLEREVLAVLKNQPATPDNWLAVARRVEQLITELQCLDE